MFEEVNYIYKNENIFINNMNKKMMIIENRMFMSKMGGFSALTLLSLYYWPIISILPFFGIMSKYIIKTPS